MRVDGKKITDRFCTTKLPLANIENAGKLRLDKLRSRETLRQVFELMDTPLEELMTEEVRCPDTSGPFSRGFLPEDLLQIAKVTRESRGGPAAGNARWFKVPKASGEDARLVQGLGRLSAALTAPRTKFTRLHELVANILARKIAMQADLKNWFYQIAVNPAWGKWLRAKIVAGRGKFKEVELTVLSMGLSLSVFIAHSLGKEIASMASEELKAYVDAWVDNLFWAVDDENI